MNNSPVLNTISVEPSFSNLPAKVKLDAIYNHSNPGELVQTLSSHDLLMTIAEVGPEDCLELLELLSPNQVQDILDLDIWRNDEIDPKKAGDYFSLLLAANTERAFAQIQGQDIELIGLILKLVAQIYDLSEGEEPPEEASLVSLSPDGRFAVSFNDDGKHKNLARSMHAFLENLYGEDMKLALELLEHVRFEVASALEEMSLKWRTNRLMDMGILSREERLSYFAPLTRAEFKPKKSHWAPRGEISRGLVIIPPFAAEGHAFLNQALSHLSAEQRTYVFEAINHAYVNIFASLCGEFSDRQEMRAVAKYVGALLEFGIAHQTLGQLDLAKDTFSSCTIKDILRFGRTVLVALRKSLMSAKKVDDYLFGKDFHLADSPLREMARALCLPEPRFYEGLLDETKFSVRFFERLTDVDAVAKAISELKFRAYFVGPKVLGITTAQLNEHPELSHAGIYARYLLNTFLKRDNRLATLDQTDLTKIFISGEKLCLEFVAYAKDQAAFFAHKMGLSSNFEAKHIQTQSEHFTAVVLIQLEKNHAALIGK